MKNKQTTTTTTIRMTQNENTIVCKFGISVDWLKQCEYYELANFVAQNGINGFDCTQMKNIRRKYRMREYRLDSYYKKTIVNLTKTRNELELTKESLETEISVLKRELAL